MEEKEIKKVINNLHKLTKEESENVDEKRENANINGNTAMGMMLQYGTEISKYYCKEFVLNKEFKELHDNGDIHIHDLDFMNMGTLTCCQIPLDKLFENGFNTGNGYIRPPQTIMSYAALTAIVIQSNQNDQHGGQSIPAFDYYLAPGVLKSFKRNVIKNIEKILTYKYDLDLEKEEIKNLFHDITFELDFSDYDKLNNGLKEKYNIELKINEFEKIFDLALEETDKDTYQAMETLVFNLNTMHSRAGSQVPFSSINFGTDTSLAGRMVSKNLLLAQEKGLGNGETAIFPILIFKIKEGINYNPNDPNYDLFKLACRVSAKRLFPNFEFLDAPFNLQYYKPNHPETEVATMGCRTRVMGNVNGPEETPGRGNTSFTSINLVRLAINHPNEEEFFQELEKMLELVTKQLRERLEYQKTKLVKNFPFLMGEGIWRGSDNLELNNKIGDVVNQGTLSVGFVGLAEALIILNDKHHGEDEKAQELGLKIIKFMRDKLDEKTIEEQLNYSLIATPAESLCGRFLKLDQEQYGVIPRITDKDFYTNSYHIPVYYQIGIEDKIKKEAPYHQYCNGGHITYVELDGDPSKNLEAFEKVVRLMKENNVGYGSINHPVDYDPMCGYHGIIPGDICPKCQRNEKDSNVKFERIRRITGYLVGTLDRFNDAKKAEEKARVKHGKLR